MSRAAPMTRTTAIAISETNSIKRNLFCRKPLPRREIWKAGMRPKRRTRASRFTKLPFSPTRGRPAVLDNDEAFGEELSDETAAGGGVAIATLIAGLKIELEGTQNSG